MKKIGLVVEPHLGDNRIFKSFHRDDCYAHFRLLQIELRKKSIDLQTIEQFEVHELDMIIFLDYGVLRFRNFEHIAATKAVFLFESPFIEEKIYKISKTSNIDLVFSWNEEYFTNSNLRKIVFPTDFDTVLADPERARSKLSAMISSAKISHDDQCSSLYAYRHSLVDYCEREDVDFDLYGVGWDKRARIVIHSDKRLAKAFNKHILARLGFKSAPKSYLGMVEDKIHTLRHYNFCFCSENYLYPDGYLTEKIWDALRAGCIPVYHKTNTSKRIFGDNLYIDAGDFDNFSDLFSFLSEMEDEEIVERRKRILAFLSSESVNGYKNESFAKFCSSEIESSLLKLVNNR